MLASTSGIIFRLGYPSNSLTCFELPAASRTADPSIRSGQECPSPHWRNTTHFSIWLLYTIQVERDFCFRQICGTLQQKSYSSYGTKLVRFSFINSSGRLGAIHIMHMNLLCFQRFLLWGIWPNRSDSLSNTLTSEMCNYNDVTSANSDLHLPETEIRCSTLERREI